MQLHLIKKKKKMMITVPDDCSLSEAIARCSPFHLCRPSDLYLGKQVLARNPTSGNYYRGEVAAINKGGTYAIQFLSNQGAKTIRHDDDDDEGRTLSNEEGRLDACLLRDIKLMNKIEKDNFEELLLHRSMIFLRNGVYDLGGRIIDIDAPLDIIGENEPRTIILGGFLIAGPLSMRSTWMKSGGSGLCNIHETMHVKLEKLVRFCVDELFFFFFFFQFFTFFVFLFFFFSPHFFLYFSLFFSFFFSFSSIDYS